MGRTRYQPWPYGAKLGANEGLGTLTAAPRSGTLSPSRWSTSRTRHRSHEASLQQQPRLGHSDSRPALLQPHCDRTGPANRAEGPSQGAQHAAQ